MTTELVKQQHKKNDYWKVKLVGLREKNKQPK